MPPGSCLNRPPQVPFWIPRSGGETTRWVDRAADRAVHISRQDTVPPKSAHSPNLVSNRGDDRADEELRHTTAVCLAKPKRRCGRLDIHSGDCRCGRVTLAGGHCECRGEPAVRYRPACTESGRPRPWCSWSATSNAEAASPDRGRPRSSPPAYLSSRLKRPPLSEASAINPFSPKTKATTGPLILLVSRVPPAPPHPEWSCPLSFEQKAPSTERRERFTERCCAFESNRRRPAFGRPPMHLRWLCSR